MKGLFSLLEGPIKRVGRWDGLGKVSEVDGSAVHYKRESERET